MADTRNPKDTQATRVMDMRPFVIPNGVEPLDDAVCHLVRAANLSKRNHKKIKDGDVIEVKVDACLKDGKSMDALMRKLPNYRISLGEDYVAAEPYFESEQARAEYMGNAGQMPVYVGDLVPGAKNGNDDRDYVYFNVKLVFAGNVEYEKEEGVERVADTEAREFFGSVGETSEPKPGTADTESRIERDLQTRFDEFLGGGGNGSGNNRSQETKTSGSGIKRIRSVGELPPELAARISPENRRDTYRSGA